jgi:glycosyltransferase involved in cell wall biosynthesis
VNILFFVPSLGGGGAERQVLRLANELRKRHDVTVAVARGDGHYEADLDPSVRVRPLKTVGSSSTFTLIQAVPNLTALLWSSTPDVLCSFMDHANVAALVAACPLGRSAPPVVVGVQNLLSEQLRNGQGQVLRVVAAGVRAMYPRAAQVVASSHGVAEAIGASFELKPSQLSVVHNAGFDDRVAQLATQPVGETLPHPLVVACGRLTHQKGYDTLLHACALAMEQTPFSLWVIGEGPERRRLEAMVDQLQLSRAVRLLGARRNPFTIMSRADLFVMSSRFEGFGNVLTEAMAVGTPVLATDCRFGPREIIGHPDNGLLVPPENPELLAEAMIELLLDEERRHAMAENGRQRAQHFSAAASAAGYERVFLDVVNAT